MLKGGTITNNTNKYSCAVCNKQYIKKASYDKHMILCNFRHKSKREHDTELEELGDIPSQYELFKIVVELSSKLEKMENRMEEMQKLVGKKKDKQNVILRLNTKIIPTIGFLEWINGDFTVNSEHFENLMKSENTLYDVIHQIIDFNLCERDGFVYPIICFTKKIGVFYICEKKEDGSPEWKKLQAEDMRLLIGKLEKNIVKELIKWKTSNKSKFDDNSKLAIMFNKVLINVMDITKDTTSTRIKNILYNYLKKDIQNIDFTTE